MGALKKKAMAFLGFKKTKSKKGATGPTVTRMNVGGGTDEEEIADEMEKRRKKLTLAGGKGQVDFKGLLGGGGSGLG